MMSILTLCQLSSTSSFPFSQWTGAGSMDWHSSHVFMAVLMAALGVAGQILLMKWYATSVDGHDLVCVQLIHVNSTSQWLGSILNFIAVNHL